MVLKLEQLEEMLQESVRLGLAEEAQVFQRVRAAEGLVPLVLAAAKAPWLG